MPENILLILLLSMAPISELRGALPVALASGMEPLWALLFCVACNLIPVPFIVLFCRKVFEWMEKRGGFLKKVVDWLENHVRKKADVYYKYELLGLFVLVAIPLPGTGAWTGALLASVLNIRLKNCFPVIALGVLTAGLIVLAVSMGAIAAFF